MIPIPFTFLLFLIFMAWFTYERKKHSNDYQSKSDRFWERENEANSTRKQPLDTLTYISIPYEELPIGNHNDSIISEQESILLSLKNCTICNLTGLTNTDLKLQYGVANLNTLIEYDDNYQKLASAVKIISDQLLELGFEQDAVIYMEYAVKNSFDISNVYTNLAKIYKKNNNNDKILELIDSVKSTNTILKDSIIARLEDTYST